MEGVLAFEPDLERARVGPGRGLSLAFNALWLGIWAAAILGIRSGHSWAFFAAWFLAIAAVVNGLAHPLAAALGRYFPGLGTSVLVGGIGGWLWVRLREATRPQRSGADPVGSSTPYILMLATAAAGATGCQRMDSEKMDENIARIEALDDQWKEAAARREFPRFSHEFDADEIIVARSGDLAVARGRYRFTPDTLIAAGSQSGKYVGVWRYVDGDWRLQINISNSDGGQ